MHTLKKAFPQTLPVMFGYVALGLAYGLLVVESGLPHWAALITSLFVYTGSLQFVMVSLMGAPISLLSVAAIALSMNTRHIFYSLAMVKPYHNTGAVKPYLIHSLSDETFALLASLPVPEGVKPGSFYTAVSFLDQMYWVLASWAGALLGSMLPVQLEGLDFVLTALLVALFTEQWLSTTEHRPALVGLLGSFACILVFGPDNFILPAMGLLLAVLFLLRGRLEGGRT